MARWIHEELLPPAKRSVIFASPKSAFAALQPQKWGAKLRKGSMTQGATPSSIKRQDLQCSPLS
jgi:hypothetical protein